jgi:hypothetical protein
MTCQLSDSASPLVYGFRFCEDPRVDGEQERELRQWAAALSEAGDPEHRAMGRAIMMLLEQIDSLRADRDHLSSAPDPDATDPPPEVAYEAANAVEADAMGVEETTVTGLRDRLRAVAHRGHD